MTASENIIIIPTYNEKENISLIIHAIFKLNEPFDILVIDDGSPDGTAAIVKDLMEREPFAGHLFLVERSGKLGLGTAYITGFKWALDHPKYEYIFEMDADFSHDPADVPRKRPCHRFTIHLWRKCSQLADEPSADELLCIQVRATSNGYSHPRYHCRLQMLPSSRVGNHSA